MSRAIFIIGCLILISCETQHIASTKSLFFFKNQKEVISRVNSNNPNYKWLDLKANIGVQGESRNINLKIRIVNKKDSLIWFSARGPLGIELFAGNINPQTISFIDRVNKTYFDQPYSYIKQIVNTDLSFYKIQEIISANPRFLEMKYKLKFREKGVHLISKKESVFITNEYEIQEVVWIDNGQRIKLKLEERHPPQNFPKKIELKIENQESLSLNINVSSVKFTKPKKLFFKIPESYVEI